MMWLVIAVVLLYFMTESISIYSPTDPSVKYSILNLMTLPYTGTHHDASEPKPYRPASPSNREEEIEKSSPKAMRMAIQRRHTASAPRGSNCVIVRITMPSNSWWRSWCWYEAVIETIAVGVYLYGTIVLTSLQFLTADSAIVYATFMALCLSMVRILTVRF